MFLHPMKIGKSNNSKTNLPLTPNSIPMAEIPDTESSHSNEARKIVNPLSFIPKTPFTKFFKLPGIFIFCIFSGYLIGRLGFNFIFLFPIAHIAYYYFERRVKEYSRTLEVIQREKKTNESLGEFESVEWMNHIIKQIWDVSEQTISSIIFNEVNNVLKKHAAKKGFSVRLAEITLGTRPPVIEKIAFLRNSNNCIVLEFATHFIPVQASDEILSYFKKDRAHWNTYIELQAVFANFVTIPLLVKNFTFSGLFKITLDLTQKIPFTKAFSLSFLEMPLIDFQLVPLKSIDMLDLPYIGSLLNMIIESQITKLLLQPNKISIDLEELTKYRGTIVGVVYVYIHDLQSIDQSTYWLTLKNNGKTFGISEKKSGSDPVFNQGFYDIIYDTTQFLGVSLFSSDNHAIYGKIHLRNLNKFIFSEKLYLSNENIKRNLNITTQFYPITHAVCESAIVSLNLISIEDLQASGDPVNRLYSTYCIVSLETREAIVSRSVLKSIETKRIFVTKNPFYNETFKFFIREFDDYIVKIRIMNEKEDSEIGKVIIPCVDIKHNISVKYRITGVESGEINVKLNLNYVDMTDPEFTNDDLKPIIKNEIEIIDEIESSEVQEHSKEFNDAKFFLGGHIPDEIVKKVAVNEELEMQVQSSSLGIYNRIQPNQRFIKYKKAYQYTIANVKAFGIFYLVFETDHVNIKMEPFSTDIVTSRSAIVPIENEKFIRVRLFMFSLNGDTLISEEAIRLDDKVVVFDKIRVEFNIETSDLLDFNGETDTDDAKILQVRIGEFDSINRPLIADFYNETFYQNVKLVHKLNTFILGKEYLYCNLKDKGKSISKVTIPKRNCTEMFNFGKSMKAPLYCMAQVCTFKHSPAYLKGEIEIFLLKVSGLKPTASGTCDPYLKVFLNGDKIYKTQKKFKSLDPIFNESFKINVNRETDTIGFHVFSVNSLSIDSLVNFKDFPLLNLPNGYSRFMIPLNDGNTGETSETEMHIIFSFKPDLSSIKFAADN